MTQNPDVESTWERRDCEFRSGGLRLAAWLYLPRAVARPPLVIMAHGFGAQRDFGLPAFAERFAAAGLGVLLFDYRCFGGSEGEPRNWVSPRRHLEDWEAALAYAKGLGEIDGARIGLWGTSFAGGHVVVTASRHPEVAAVVSQVPLADGMAAIGGMPLRHVLRMQAAGFRDLFRMLTGGEPVTLPIIGRPGDDGILNAPGCWEGYQSIVPEGTSWRNACPARIVLTAGLYRPTRVAERVRCPALLVMAERDQLIPCSSVEKEAAKMPRSSLLRVDCDHFEPYTGAWFEKVVAVERDFLVEHLAPSPSTIGPR